MKYKTLPGTDLNVSEICLGTMTWGEQNSEAEAHAQLDCAFAQGVNFIDTAEMYPVPPNATTQGRTEAFLGNWLARRKPGNHRRDEGGGSGAARAGFGTAAPISRVTSSPRPSTRASPGSRSTASTSIRFTGRNGTCRCSGRRSSTRGAERSGPGIEEQVEGLAAMIKAGKIRYYGLSNETAWGVCEFQRVAKAHGLPGPVTIQNSYSLLSRGVDNDLAETLFRENMSLLAYSPLGGGILSGQVSRRSDARQFALRAVRHSRLALSQADRSRGRRCVRHARGGVGVSLVQLALGYVKSRWHVGATILGATSLAQLEQNFAAAKIELDAATLEAIAAVQIQYPNPAAEDRSRARRSARGRGTMRPRCQRGTMTSS